MINKRLSIWLLLLLTLAWPLLGKVRINEIMFDTGTDPDAEFIELYNEGPGNVDLQNWSLVVDGTPLVTFPNSLPLAAGDYLAVFVGSPTTPPAASYSLGLTEPAIGDTGSEILLQDDNGDPHDYIAYGAVSANPPSPLVFPSPISPGSWVAGDGLAFIEPDGTDSDAPGQWINRRGDHVTPGAVNTQQPAPTVSYGTITVPGSFPNVNACDEIEVPINVNYSHETPIFDANLSFTVPGGFFFASAGADGVFDATTRKVSWSLGALNGNKSVSVRVRPSCSTTSGQFIGEGLALSFLRFAGQSPAPTVSGSNATPSFNVSAPALTVTMTEYGTGNSAIVADISTLVEFQIEVKNTGSAPMTGAGAYMTLQLKPDLLFVGFRKNGPTGDPVDYLDIDVPNGIFTGWTGAMDPGDTRSFYVKAMNVGCAEILGSAKIALGWGCGDGVPLETPGRQTCSIGANTSISVLCPPTLTFAAPSGAPPVYMGCQDVTHNIIMHNPNGVPLRVTGLELNLPTDTYWISSKIGATDVGTYDQPTKKLTFTAAELTGGTGEIAANGTITVVLVMRPNCVANTDRQASGVFNYEFGCLNCGWLPGSVSTEGRGVPLRQPALAVTVQDPNNPDKTTVLAERGETVTFKVVVVNNGMGDLNTASEGGGWVQLLSVGNGLALQGVTDITGGTPGTTVTPVDNRWETGTMTAGTSRSYLVEFLVRDCVNVNYEVSTYWECAGTHADDHCRQDGESKGSVNIILRNPSLSITTSPFAVDYCNGVDVSIPVTNANEIVDGEFVNGMARDVRVDMMGISAADFEITMAPGSPFTVSHAGNMASFSLVDGEDCDQDGKKDDIGRGGSYSIDFTVKVKDGVCNPSAGGPLIYQPYYEDSCNIPYTSGTQLSSFTRSELVGVSLTKSGPAVANVGDTDLTWTITLNYTGEPNDPFEYTLTDDYPNHPTNPFGHFVVKSFSEGGAPLTEGLDYTDINGVLTRTVSTNFDADGNFSQTYTIVFDTPNSVCAGGQTYTNNAKVVIAEPIAPIDCNNCSLPKTLTAASSIIFNNSDEDYIDQHTRRVRYDNLNTNGLDNSAYQAAAEVCTTMVFDQILHFSSASPNSWKVDVDPGPAVDMRSVRFHDALDANLRAPGGIKENLNVKIYYFSGTTLPAVPSGTDYGPGGSNLVTWNDVSYVPGNSVGIDLGGLDGITGLGGSPAVPQDAGILWIRYTLQSQANSIGDFNDFAMVAVPLPGGDPCGRGPEAEYHYMTPVSVADSDPTVSISSSAPFSISRCETITLRFNLGMATSHPFDVYDNRLVVDLRGNYRYLDGTTVFGDALLDEGSQAITSFEPAVAGSTLTWNIGDIRGLSGGGNRYVEIQVQKTCDQSSTRLDATLLSNDHCSQIPDGNGPGQANKQDTVIAGISSFINSAGDSYEPLLYSGRLETRFASQRVFYNDAYPSVLLHVVNSGNGTLYNARIPVELGSVLNDTGSLTFLEAHVTAVSGQASVIVDNINPITPVALEDASAHGYRKVTLGVDWMGPSSIVTIRLRLRMVLCADLSLKINQAHWGCPPGPDNACPANLDVDELNSSMEIKSGGARVVVIEHQPTPSILDLCGSRIRMAVEVLNAGSVNVYEPIIRERLPEGLQIVPSSVEYSINGGVLTPFPEAGGTGTGLRYTSLTTNTTPGIGTYQTILWNFTDPNGDHNEDDSLLPSPAFDDPKPDDPLFNRHRVMKPQTRLRIEFEAELDGCANVDAYQKSDKRGVATLLFDLPCHHDNRVDAAGNTLATPRLPLDDNTREVTLIDPGKADVQVNLKGQNITQNAPESANQVNAELNDEIEWTVTLKSLGPGVVPHPTLELFVPSILSVDFVNDPPVITSPGNIVFVNSNPTGVPQANPAGTKYTFVFKNTDPAMVAADREYYFSATETVKLTIPSKLTQCIFEKPTLEARLLWGCCPGLLDASGQHMASMPIKSRADEPFLSIVEGDDGNNVITEFDSCLGAYTITLTSPITNRNLSLWDLDVTMTLPNGWAYAPTAGDGTDFIYAGTDPRPDAYKLTSPQEEPLINGKTLRWTSTANGGYIPVDRARIFPREELKIVVYLKADGTNINCDLDPGPGQPTAPDFTQSVSASYKDSCGGTLDSPQTSQVTISPKTPKLSVVLIPTPSTYFISGSDTTVNWILRLWNNGDKTATNIELDLDFGAGYSSVTFNSGTPPPTQTGNSFAWAVGTIAELAPLGHIDWHFTGNIDTTNRNSLTAHAIVKGHCKERDGSLGCAYSYQELEEFVSGAAIAKTLDGTRLAAPAASTPTANDAAAVSANVSVGSILRNVIRVDVYEGGLTNLEVRDVLPSGLVFLEANLVDSAGALVANLTPTSTTNNIITFSHSTVSQLANITGGRTGANALFIEIWTRVDDNTTIVTDGELLTNTAQLTVKRGTRTFDHTTTGVLLHSANEFTVQEPFIQADASLAKTSVPVSLPEDHTGAPLNIAARPTGDDPVAYTFTAKNTGTSPAYELKFTDLIPWQLENPGAQASPYNLTVTITPTGGGADRVLQPSTDFTTTWAAGAAPNPGTFTITLQNTADATLGVNETITIAYYGKIATFAPGTFVDNSGKISGYSSLPGDGATLTTARGTSLAENADQRVSYANTYRPLPEKRTYHKFTSELDATGGIIAEVTPMSDGAAPALRSDGTTRATIGEKVEYHLRLDLPSLIRLYDLSFSLDVPDGLTVDSAKWEIVATGGDFSGAQKTLSFTELGTGITQVRGQAGAGANDFPQPINNTSGSGQEMLVKVLLRVDRNYAGGTPVLTGNSFSLPASFAWGEIGSVAIAPIPAFTIVEPELSTLTKERNAHLQSDNSTAASYVGTGSYRNFNDKGPDNLNPTPKTDPVDNVYQVRAGEIVEYKLTFRNDGTGAAWDVTLRDTVPAGMTLRTGSISITTNPVDAGITISTPTPAATLDFAINRVLPGHEVTVLYRCNVDTNVAAGRYLQNQADIVQYSSLPAAPQVAWPDYDRSVTSGDSAQYAALGPMFEKVGTPFPTSSKSVAAEFTAPDGGTIRATIGEKITYELRLNIPDTSTLYDLKLVDVVPDGLQVHSATYSINGAPAVEMDRTVNDADGTTTVTATTNPFGDVSGFTGVTDDIVITIIAGVKQAYHGGAIVDAGDVFANNATFTWNQVNDDDATVLSRSVAAAPVTFTIVEPKLETLTKDKAAVSPAAFGGPLGGYLNYDPSVGPNPNAVAPVDNVEVASPDQTVRYTLTVKNSGDGIAYGVVLIDTIPVGMGYVAGTAGVTVSPSSATPSLNVGEAGQDLTFTLDKLAAGDTATITYQLKVAKPAPAGRFLLNKAKLHNYRSTPSTSAYHDDARDIVTERPAPQQYDALGPAFTYLGTAFPTATKTVESEFTPIATDGTVCGTIGEVMTYTLQVNIPDDHILYDLHIRDVIPTNLKVRNQNPAATYITYAKANHNGVATTYNAGSAQLAINGQEVSLYLQNDDVQAIVGNDKEVELFIAVTVEDVAANVDGTVFENTMEVSWNQINESPGAPADRTKVNSFVKPAPTDTPDSVDFTILEPKLAVTTLTKALYKHYESNGTTEITSTGTAEYNNYNPRGPTSHEYADPTVPNVRQVRPTEILEFIVTFKNTGNTRVYDILLTDVVPPGLTLLKGGVNDPEVTGTTTTDIDFLNSTPEQPGGSGTPINFKVNWLNAGDTCEIKYRTQVESTVGVGAYLQNELSITDYGTTPDASATFPTYERDTDSTVPYTDPHPKYEKVGTPFPSSSKTVESQYTGPTGKLKDGSSRGTIGERMTYELRLNIPDTTTLYDLTVTDVLPDGLQPYSATYSINGGPTDVAMTIDGQTVSCTTFGNVTGGGASVTDEIIITIVAIVKQAYSGGAAVKADDVFGNNAVFTWKQVSGGGAATVWTRNFEPSNVNFTVLEPKLETLTKEKAPVAPAAFGGPLGGYRNYETVGPNPNNSGPVNNVDVVKPGDEVLYTLTFINNGGSTAYDIDLTDIIPIGMSYVAGSAGVSTTTAQTTAIAFRTTPTAPPAPNRNLVFELNLLESGKTAKIEYKLQVDTPAAAGRFLLNQVMLDNYRSLPSTMPAPADARDIETTTRPLAQRYSTLGPAVEYVGTAFPTATKAVRREFPLSPDSSTDTVHGTIGELMTYELKVDIPDNHILYDLQILDVVPANLTVQEQNLVPAYITYADVNNYGTTTRYNAGSTELSVAGSTVTLYLPSDVRAANGVTNEIQFEIAVTIDDNAANTAGVVKANTMEVSWNQVDQGSGVASGDRNTLNSFVTPGTGTVDFTIIEPELLPDTLTKSRSGYFTSVGSPIPYLGTASYNNYNADGPESHLSKLSPVPNVDQVKPTDIVEYTVTFTNTGDARVYDILLTDYVPNGFTLLAGGSSVTGGTTAGINFINSTPAQAGGSGNPITFAVNWLDPGQTGTIKFRTQIDTDIAAGAYLQNKIVITDFGTTPDATAKFPALERDTGSTAPYTAPNPKYEKVGTQYPPFSLDNSSKTIQTELTPPGGKKNDGSSRATIGELVTYEMLIDIPDNLQLFDLEFSDPLPDGLSAVSATYSIWGASPVNMTIATSRDAQGRTLISATLGDIAANLGSPNPEVVFIIKATVDQKFAGGGGSNNVADGSVINNTATLTWNQADDVTSPSTQDHSAALTILEPKIESTGFTKVITQVLDSDGTTPVTTSRGHDDIVSTVIPKASNGKTSYYKYPVGGGNPVLVDNVQVVLPEDFVEYKITVTNSGTAHAFDVKISDILPRVDAVEYVQPSAGLGPYLVGTLPYQSGTPNSKLTVTPSTVSHGGYNCTKLDFTIDVLENGQSAVILYRVRVKQGLGAGNYIGPNVANLDDYGTLPDQAFGPGIQIGNLPPETPVHNNSLERDTTSDPAYPKRGPVGEDIGVQYPEFSTTVYRRYDEEGREITPPTPLAATTNIRIGELLTYELTATLPRYTALFDGGASGDALAFRHRLNRGYHLLTGTEQLGGTITGLVRKGAPAMTVLDSMQNPTWLFEDIVNGTNSAQTAQLRFQVEVRSKEYNDNPYFTDQKASIGQINRSYLFWNTIDAAEKDTFNAVADVNSGDHPFLQRDSVITSVVQPNLQLFKDSVPEPGSFIGVSTGIGDLITYTLTLRNWNSLSAGNYQGQGLAYNAKITDILPKDIAPLDIAGLTLTAAVHSINTDGTTGALVQNLTLDEDYTFSYAFNNTTQTGTITFTTIRDTANNDYDSRIDANQALVISYEVTVNPDIGAQGAGAGKRVNYAMLENYYSFPEGLNDPDRKQYGPD
ncbi:MAG: isopeptide-forming domain-containing fimbrial protein, partial [Lentisphaeria bacterium]